MLEYLSGYTHRVAISNSRLLETDNRTVTFRVKNYRADGLARHTTMKLDVAKFIRRFLRHLLPKGFYRIRHYGLLATGTRAENVKRARALLDAAVPRTDAGDLVSKDAVATDDRADSTLPPCPCCGSRLLIIERFQRGEVPRHQPSPPQLVFRLDTS